MGDGTARYEVPSNRNKIGGLFVHNTNNILQSGSVHPVAYMEIAQLDDAIATELWGQTRKRQRYPCDFNPSGFNHGRVSGSGERRHASPSDPSPKKVLW